MGLNDDREACNPVRSAYHDFTTMPVKIRTRVSVTTGRSPDSADIENWANEDGRLSPDTVVQLEVAALKASDAIDAVPIDERRCTAPEARIASNEDRGT
jgi:hypothetical protein